MLRTSQVIRHHNSQPRVATMDTVSVPRTQHQPAGSQPYSVTLVINGPSTLRGRPCGGIDLRWVRSVAAGGIFLVFLLAASRIAFPSASVFIHPYPAATQPPSPVGTPRFAYLVSGSAGEAGRLHRCLFALYHPRNHYILHLDAEASDSERTELAAFLAAHPVLAAVGNVRVLEKADADLVTHRGSTMVTTTLGAAATFLRGPGADWDWFINLSASHYPLVTQDDLMDVFSRLPRDLNFLDHTSDMASPRAMVDPGHYMNGTEKRELRQLPTTIFTGSAWTVLSRPFVEYLIRGWKNLPRNLLVSSPEAYFHTMACNAEEFRNTTVNHDMHYISWGGSPARQPELINSSHWDGMLGSDAPFACNFGQDNPVLDRIDAELLLRQPGMLAPGSWSIGDTGGDGSFWIVRDATPLRPGPGATRLQRLLTSLLSEENFRPKQCKIVNHSA
ncbi:beta-glucuronosyltransferase GlcAT14B-like [Aegilops tauschii subsp. strangulata]|nr:beta-glucuronosyltransferase GlcAT14B-like [Aegilops tauschii subsp. strangulata]